MSDNRTADTAEQVLDRWVTWDYELENAADKIFFLKAMEEYASQQTASLREENEKLKSEAKEQYSAGLMCERILAKDQIKQLQEEVDRLTGWLIDVDKDFNCLTDSQRKALSSKESKPS